MGILTYPNKALSINWTDSMWQINKEELSEPEFISMVECMIDTLYMRKALGLAANQIGEPEPVFILDVDGDPLIAINPTIHLLGEMVEVEEACLSLPGIDAKVPRSKYVRLIYTTMEGEVRSDMFEGLQAQAVQHEMDHLTGKLYWDCLSSMKKDMLKRRYKKIHKYK